MSEDKKDGGSNQKPPENKIAQMSIDQALAENEALKLKITELQTTVDDLTKQLKAANDVLEAQEKARLIREILPRSNFTVEDLDVKSPEELKEIRATLDQAKLPTYKNIHFGLIGADEKDDEGLTVGDLSVVTAAKRKAGRP
jgi:hypothetical protein